MARITWEGNQDWEKNFPDGQSLPNAVRLKRPQNILNTSLPYGVIPLILCFICVFLKKSTNDEFIFDWRFMPLSFIAGFLLIPAHEFLHAICYPIGGDLHRCMLKKGGGICPVIPSAQ